MEKIVLEPVSADVIPESFDCGEKQINDQIYGSYYRHLLEQIRVYQIRIASYIVGYVAVSITSVMLESADGDISDYCDGDSRFGALKIDFIAVDKKLHGKHIGSTVIQMIIKQARIYSHSLPIRIIVLDAINSRISWYIDRGFKRLNSTDDQSFTKGMYLDIMDECQKQTIEKYCEDHI